MGWTSDVDDVIKLCNEMSIRIETHIFHTFENSKFNVSDAVNMVRRLQRPDFFKQAAKLIAHDPIRIEIVSFGEVYTLSIRCLNILCKLVAKAGLVQVNAWSSVYNMEPIPNPVKIKPCEYYAVHDAGIVIGCETQLQDINKLEFTIAIQVSKYKDVEIYKCRVDYNQIIKLITKFESLYANSSSILHIMTFVDRHPVIILLDGKQILYKPTPSDTTEKYCIPIVCVCQYDKVCAKPICAYSHRVCGYCKIYNSPAHMTHCHNINQTTVMESMRYVYKVNAETRDIDVEQMRQNRVNRNGRGRRTNRVLSHVMGEDGELKSEDTPAVMAQTTTTSRAVKTVILNKDLIRRNITQDSATNRAHKFLSEMFGKRAADEDDTFSAKRTKD